ncbi:MAG: hypothetical protein C5B57_12585 [Blastocatellia bacterium]|nr:MAG: hypothetical protein C5B57_12585 [Blastocatellia bacterium]
MIKLVIKLAVAALLANGVWRVGNVYLAHYRFTDAIEETLRFGSRKSGAEIHQRVLALASQYDIPIVADTVAVRRDDRGHTFVDGSYRQPVDLLPWYQYRWPFTVHLDVVVADVPLLEPSTDR